MRFRRKVVSRFFAVITLMAAIISFFPGQALAAGEFTPTDAQFDAAFENRVRIRVTKFDATQVDRDAGRINDELNDFSISQINTFISQQIEGTFVASDATDPGSNYIRDNGNCDSRIQKQGNDYQLDQPRIVVSGKGCIEVYTADLKLNNAGVLNFDNYFIMFNWKNQNTLVRVDGRDGDFVEDASQPTKYFRIEENGEGDQDFVDLNDARTAGQYTRQIPDANDVTVDIEVGQPQNRTNPPTDPDTVSSTDPDGEQRSCESEGGDLSWILCPVLFLGDSIVGRLDEALQNVLEVPNTYFEDPDVRVGWARIRNIAYFILVPIVLFMVISTALGFEFVSAYTVKKALPRLVMAVIFIALSYEITTFLIIATNDIGSGIYGLIVSAFTGSKDITLAQIFNPSSGDSAIGLVSLLGAGAVGVAIGSIGIIMSYLLVLVIGLLIGFLLLSLRQMLLVALLLLAPLAILAWIFPGNDKLWKTWWGAFSKLLLLYPLIMILLATGKSFAVIVGDTRGDLVGTLIKLTAYVGPYFLIPATFKFAGGVFATVAGMANDRERGLFDRQKKYRQGKMSENWGKTRNYSRFSDRNKLTRGMNTMLGAGANPRDILKGRSGIQAGRQTGRANQGVDIFKSDPTMAANQNDDNFLLAIANERLARQKLATAQTKFEDARQRGDMTKMNQYQAEIDARTSGLANAQRVQSRKSGSTRMAALQQLSATGYQFDQGEAGYKELASTVQEITGGDTRAYASAMNNAQYNLKNAGRYDLAGLNNGAGYDAEAGLAKVDPYTMASRAKPETIQAKGRLMRESLSNALAAQAAGNTAVYDAEMEKAEVHRLELDAIKDSATGKNKSVATKEIQTIEGEANFAAWRTSGTGRTKVVREDYVAGAPGWSADDAQRGWRSKEVEVTKGEAARSKAQGGRRPNPRELED